MGWQQWQWHGQQQQQLQAQAATLASESEALNNTRGLLQSEQTRNAGLNQALADFELRLKVFDLNRNSGLR